MYSTDIFKSKANKVHNYKYDYSLINYTGCYSKITIVCPIHGRFEQSACSHLTGRGCVLCGDARTGLSKRLSLEDFLIRAKTKHGDSYDYSQVEYKNNTTPVLISCKLHGNFYQTPASHFKGGCISCGIIKSSEKGVSTSEIFIQKAKAVHKDLYDYSLVCYKRNNINVSILCKKHGIFKQSPANHLEGKGCRLCANYGYKILLPGTVYILVFENIVKVGITNRSVNRRLSDICKDSCKDFKVHSSFNFTNGVIPYEIERLCLKYLRNKYQPVLEKFDGSTECFLNVDIADLLNFVNALPEVN